MTSRESWTSHIAKMGTIGLEGCPFCNDSSMIVKEFSFWNIFKNKYPYNNCNKHFLVVPKRHVEHTSFLENNELLELKEIEKYMQDLYKGEEYFSFIRQTNGGKSIKHIHYHYLPGVLYAEAIEQMLQKQEQ